MLDKLDDSTPLSLFGDKINEIIDVLNGFHITHQSVNRPVKTIPFDEAVKAFRAGKRIKRSVWNGDELLDPSEDHDTFACRHIKYDDWIILD